MKRLQEQLRPAYAIADGGFGTAEIAEQDTRIKQIYLLARSDRETQFLEEFVLHPTRYDQETKPPKWLEKKGTETTWDHNTQTGSIKAHDYTVQVSMVHSEEELAGKVAEKGQKPQNVLVLTASESQAEIILNPSKLQGNDKLLSEKRYNVATVGGLRKTDAARFDTFRRAWGFLVGQSAYFQESSSGKAWNGEAIRNSSHVLPLSWFDTHRTNPKPRFVPDENGIRHEISSFELFNTPDNATLNWINSILENARKNGQRPVIYIPTCPPDAYYWEGKNTIAYSDTEPLQDSIAWTTENTLDALETMLPMLRDARIAPEIVFGIGDYEHSLGYTRGGMTEEHFRHMINLSEIRLRDRLQAIMANVYGGQQLETTTIERQITQGVNEVQMKGANNLPIIRITGMMELAGGKDDWDRRFRVSQQEALAVVDPTSRYSRLTQRTLASRQKMVDHWLTMRGEELTNENRRIEFASRDLPSYLTFHNLIRELWGKNFFILAGDSRPNEECAATLAHNPIVTVSGLYKGASFE